MARVVLLGVVALVTLPTLARAGVIQFTSTVVADYEFSLLGRTPLNPGETTPFIPFRAFGDLTFTLSSALNDPTQTTVPFLNVTGVLQGIPPSPEASLPHTISPNVEFLSGTLTNITRDASGRVIAADVVNLSMRWELIGTGSAFPVRLYTKDGLPFDAQGVTIPFSVGTVLRGPAVFDVYLDDGDGNPTNDPLVVQGRNRTLTVVPEPASVGMWGMMIAVFAIVVAHHVLRKGRIPAMN